VIRRLTPDLAIAATATVGEGPVVDARSGRLCWVDLAEGVLFETDLDDGSTVSWPTGTLLGAAVPRATEPGFAVAVADGFGLLVDGELTIVDPVLPSPDLRMNDAKCDARGRLWAGSTELGFRPGAGRLHVWSGGESVVVADGLTLPNGLGWDAGNTTMYLDDSVRGLMLAATYDVDAGSIGPLEAAFEIPGGLPDGFAVDLDGCLWVAVWGAGEVRRYRPDGSIDAIVEMPVSQPSSCAFAADGTLFITSASGGVDLSTQPLAGSVFAVATSTRGVAVAAFAG
jgi:sugar lactone lactonase YvrE